MSVAVSHHPPPPDGRGREVPPPRRRVRQELWDALAVAGFSAAASVALALAVTFVLAIVG